MGDRRDARQVIEGIGRVRPDAAAWVVQGGRAGDPTILLVGRPAAPPAAVIRLARSPAVRLGLDQAAAALTGLHDRVAPDSAAIIPSLIASGALRDRQWLAEVALTGRSARERIGDRDSRRSMLAATTGAISVIHEATAHAAGVDDVLIERWIGVRARRVAGALGGPAGESAAALERMAAAASAEIRGRTLPIGWIHGDLWPANVLVDRDPPVVTGIIDWDSAADGELALHDRLHLALTTRRLVERRHLGPLLADLLRGAASWSAEDRIVLDRRDAASVRSGPGSDDGFTGLPERVALTLYWLRFVESNLVRHPRLAADRSWRDANVVNVLACA